MRRSYALSGGPELQQKLAQPFNFQRCIGGPENASTTIQRHLSRKNAPYLILCLNYHYPERISSLMVAEFPHTLTDEERLRGQTANARKSKAERERKWLDYESFIDSQIRTPKIKPLILARLIDTQDKVAERLRILSGAVKPGSRNVSVRELSADERQRKLAAARSRSSDYLADARATLAQAEAITKSTEAP